MIKNINTLAMAAMLTFAVPFASIAAPMIEIVEFIDIDAQAINISVEQNIIRVTGAAGQTMSIYNVAGVCVQTVKIDSDDKQIELTLQKGCYIVKIGKVARKVSIR